MWVALRKFCSTRLTSKFTMIILEMVLKMKSELSSLLFLDHTLSEGVGKIMIIFSTTRK